MTYRLTLPYPPSANRYWRKTKTGRVYVSAEAKAYKTEVGWLLNQYDMLDGAIYLVYDFYRPRKVGDLDNRIKVLQDAMQGYVYEDDKDIVSFHPTRYEDKHNPRVEVMVTNDLEIYTQAVVESLALLKEME